MARCEIESYVIGEDYLTQERIKRLGAVYVPKIDTWLRSRTSTTKEALRQRLLAHQPPPWIPLFPLKQKNDHLVISPKILFNQI